MHPSKDRTRHLGLIGLCVWKSALGTKIAGIKRYYSVISVAIRGDLAGNLITFRKTEEV